MNSTMRVALLLSSVSVFAAGTAFADATDTSATSRTARSDALEEIVVTAEKRSSTVQDTPISMTAMSGDLMQQEGIIRYLTGVIQAVPGISRAHGGTGTNRAGNARAVVLGRFGADGRLLSG